MNTNDAIIIARELRDIRENPPATVGEALPRYATALVNARRLGVPPATVLLFGELLWMALRPEQEPAPDEIGGALDRIWEGYEAELNFCSRPGAAGERSRT